MKCKLGGDDWKNKEGYILIDGELICSDWDVDCTQCLVEKCQELVGKWRRENEEVGATLGQPVFAKEECMIELEAILDISELAVK